MICSSTWPNYRGNEKDGVKALLKDVSLDSDAEYGKTKIFIRTPQSITTLEDMRSTKIPQIVLLLQRVSKMFLLKSLNVIIYLSYLYFFKNIRGGLARRYVKKLRAKRTIIACYRHWKMKVYLNKVIKAFG